MIESTYIFNDRLSQKIQSKKLHQFKQVTNDYRNKNNTIYSNRKGGAILNSYTMNQRVEVQSRIKQRLDDSRNNGFKNGTE